MDGRNPNWASSEKCMAISLINDNYDELFAKFKGATTGAIDKKGKWQEIADTLNSAGVTQCLRTVDQIKRMYANVKQRAKEKEGDRRRTGGGPLNKLSVPEDLVLEGIQAKPQLRGIEGGIDSSTECPESVTISEVEQVVQDESIEMERHSEEKETEENGLKASCSKNLVAHERLQKITGKGKKRKSFVEDELYMLEKRRSEAELKLLEQRISQEKEIFQLKKEMLLSSMVQEKTLFILKEKLLNENLKKAYDENLLVLNEN